jgi:hypothetical protein
MQQRYLVSFMLGNELSRRVTQAVVTLIAGITLCGFPGYASAPHGYPAADQRLACPPGDESKRQQVVFFLTDSQWEDERSDAGVDTITPSQIRLMVDDRDASACEQIHAINRSDPPQYEIAYYKAGDFYFVVTEPITNPDEMGYNTPFIVLDSDFNVVKGFFM